MKIKVILTGGTVGSEKVNGVVKNNKDSNIASMWKEKFNSNIDFDVVNLYSILSENIKNKIDEETSKLVQEAYSRAENLLKNNLVLLDRIANELLNNDVLDEIDLNQICHDEADKNMKQERKNFRHKHNNITSTSK